MRITDEVMDRVSDIVINMAKHYKWLDKDEVKHLQEHQKSVNMLDVKTDPKDQLSYIRRSMAINNEELHRMLKVVDRAYNPRARSMFTRVASAVTLFNKIIDEMPDHELIRKDIVLATRKITYMVDMGFFRLYDIHVCRSRDIVDSLTMPLRESIYESSMLTDKFMGFVDNEARIKDLESEIKKKKGDIKKLRPLIEKDLQDMLEED